MWNIPWYDQKTEMNSVNLGSGVSFWKSGEGCDWKDKKGTGQAGLPWSPNKPRGLYPEGSGGPFAEGSEAKVRTDQIFPLVSSVRKSLEMDDSENPRTAQKGDEMVWMTDEGSPNYPEERGSVGREDEWTWEIFRRLQELISLIHSSRALRSSMCQGQWVCQMVAGFWRMTKSQSREQSEKDDPSKGAACTKVTEACPETRAHDGAGWGEKRDREAWTRPQKAGLLCWGCKICSWRRASVQRDLKKTDFLKKPVRTKSPMKSETNLSSGNGHSEWGVL